MEVFIPDELPLSNDREVRGVTRIARPMRTVVALLVVCLWTADSAVRLAMAAEGQPVHVAQEPRIFRVEREADAPAGGDPGIVAMEHLGRNRVLYGLPAGADDLRLVRTSRSLLGQHLHFQQYAEGVPVLRAGVTISLSLSNSAVYLVHSATVDAGNRERPGKMALDAEGALDRAWAHLGVRGWLKALPRSAMVWIPVGDRLRLGYGVDVACTDPLGAWEVLVDAETGVILGSSNLMRTDGPKGGRQGAAPVAPGMADAGDPVSRREATAAFIAAAEAASSPVPAADKATAQGSAWLFDPDPKTALASDSLPDAAPASAFVPAMVQRPLRDISFDGGVYRLVGPWVTIADFDPPYTPPSTTADGNWAFPRGDSGFTDAMAYFHIDGSQRHLQSLGYFGATGIQDLSIRADTDGVNGDDNSYFDPSGNNMSFGHGGVDDCEDADVILHEYGHAIEYGIEPNYYRGDTGAMGEGFGDYWAASHSLSCLNGPAFHPDWVFQWDGHNEFWDGRVLDSTARYNPGSTYDAHVYVDGVLGDELWSAPLFQSLKRLLAAGRTRDEADTVVIESHFGMGFGTRMPAMASNVVATALDLFPSGPHAGIFFSEFTNRNILTKWQLGAPSVVFPPAGECLVAGAARHLRWLPRPAPVQCGAEVQFRENGALNAYWLNDVEGGTGGWTVSYSGGARNWARVTATNHSPVTSWWADEQTVKARMYLASPGMVLSNGVTFGFWHKFNLQAGYDGGVVEISTNNGAAWVDVTTNVTSAGYGNLTLIKTASDNPIKGRKAFSGSSGGFVQSFIDLARFAGKTVKIRFCMATDSSARATAPRGWWIDDMSLVQEAWEPAGVAAAGECCILWTPPRQMTAAVVRVKAVAQGCVDSAWATGRVFSVSADTDGDLLPDTWEIANFGSLALSSGTGDHDADGSPDYAEWVAGTCPTQATSVLKAVDLGVSGESGISLGWTSVTGRSFSVEWTADLAARAFAVAASNLVASPPTNRWSGSVAPGPSGAFRIRVDP